jgi:hypothetical protein
MANSPLLPNLGDKIDWEVTFGYSCVWNCKIYASGMIQIITIKRMF